MSVHHVVRHSRPASVRVTFVSFINHYYFVTIGPLNAGGIVALHWFGEYVSSFFHTGVFWFFRIWRCHRESQISDKFESQLADCQSAYRKYRSCETTLVGLVEDWKKSKDEGMSVGILSTDMSKAC